MVSIRVSARGGTVRIALVESGIFTEYALWRQDAPDGVGDLYTGRVTAHAPALGGAFVELGGLSGFLPDSAGGRACGEGDYLAVEVTRAAQGGKGPRLRRVEAPVADRPGLIRRGGGPLLDLAVRYPEARIIADDYALIAQFRGRLDMSHDPGAFDAGLEDEIAALAAPLCALPGGAAATITPTPALTAIDIDAGAATADRASKSRAQARLNHEVIPELARQIRLRNLGGAILIDFAGMKPAARASLAPALETALARDPLHPRLLGFTGLGFAEILRPRIRPPLHEVLSHERTETLPDLPQAAS
jgi:Ribonuclease G/E